MRALPENNTDGSEFSINHVGDEIPTTGPFDLRERDACGVGFIANLKGIKSHDVLQKSIQALNCNEHRGGCNYDGLTGDGAGLMTQIPWEIFQKWAKDENKSFDKERTIVGTMFLSRSRYEQAIEVINEQIKTSDFELIGWRDVPTDIDVLGEMARDAKPEIWHLIIQAKDKVPSERLEAEAYIFRKKVQKQLDTIFGRASCSVTSFST
jgi:glutamate synthase (ferredoxin)